MSDLDKLFENAPKGAVELRWDGNIARFFNCCGEWFYGNDASWRSSDCNEGWKTIATRPQPEEPRKTVEDAVEWANGVWTERDCDAIAYNPTSESFGYYESRIGLNEKWYHVCNQSEFEACVAAKTKSEPEWTHVTKGGTKCNVIAETKNRAWIVYENGDDNLVNKIQIKPIKPTITKSEQLTMAEMAGYFDIDPDDFINYVNMFEVVA